MTTLDTIIEQKRALIVEMFVSEVRIYRLAPAHKTNEEIAHNLDDYLSAIAHVLRRGHSKDPEALRIATAHGEQRSRLGYDLVSLVGEFGILRSTIVEIAQQSNALTIPEMERLCEVLHVSVLAALVRFVVAAGPPAERIVSRADLSAVASLAAGLR
jgi:hypothetical protein